MEMKCPRGPDRLFQARSSIYQGIQNRKNCRYSITATVAVTRSVSAIPFEKITEILCFGVRGGAQQWFDVKDFLQRFQGGAVVVVDGIGKSLLTLALAAEVQQRSLKAARLCRLSNSILSNTMPHTTRRYTQGSSTFRLSFW
jgi:hypothetical protein